MSKRIAIHQPNFFPWLPWFDKLRSVDEFVILAHCQWEKGGYQNRFFHGQTWYTMSVTRGLDPICEKVYKRASTDWTAIRTGLAGIVNLAAFDAVFVDERLGLLDVNLEIIRRIAKKLKIGTPLVADWPTTATGTARLVEICRERGADLYVAGASGPDYMDLGAFSKASIKVAIQESAPDRRRSIITEIA